MTHINPRKWIIGRKIHSYTDGELDYVKNLIGRYYSKKHPKVVLNTSEANYEDLASEINIAIPDAGMTSSFICDIYNKNHTSEKKSIRKMNAIIDYTCQVLGEAIPGKTSLVGEQEIPPLKKVVWKRPVFYLVILIFLSGLSYIVYMQTDFFEDLFYPEEDQLSTLCYENSMKYILEVSLYLEDNEKGTNMELGSLGVKKISWNGSITVPPGQKVCFYHIKLATYIYFIKSVELDTAAKPIVNRHGYTDSMCVLCTDVIE